MTEEGTMGAELVGIGNAMVDVFSPVDEDVGPLLGLTVHRSIHVDYQRLNEILVALPSPQLSAGGGTANTIKIASLLGIATAFVGTVGSGPGPRPLGKGEADSSPPIPGAPAPEDRFARIFRNDMAEMGVQTHLTVSPKPTGLCAIVKMPDQGIAIAACPSAALDLQPQDIPEKLIRQAKIVMLDGFLLQNQRVVERVLELANRFGTIIAMDVGSSAVAAERALEIAGYCRSYPVILFMNEEEATAFCTVLRNGQTPEEVEPEERYKALKALTADNLFPIIVVKRGDQGALVFAGNDVHSAPTVATIPFDATGAGDAFAAAFLSAWLRNRSLSECAAQGNRLAREVLKVPGTRLDCDRLKKVARSLGTDKG
jgi:sugar/nucleoside kinase (ribokinase family)